MVPALTLADHIVMAADTLVATLQYYSTSPHPEIKIGNPIIQGVRQIDNILKTMYPLPTPTALIPKLTTSPIITQPILPTRIPEEKLCEYYLQHNTALTNLYDASILAPVPRVEMPPVPHTHPVVSLPRVKKYNSTPYN